MKLLKRIFQGHPSFRPPMNIHEYQGKAMFREYGITVQDGIHCRSVEEAVDAYHQLGSEIVAVKSQIHAGGRGKGKLYNPSSGDIIMEGGVKIASTKEEVEVFSTNILGNRLVTKQTGVDGKIVQNLYLESGCSISHEYYLAILVDREKQSILVMASTEGGMDIEEVAETNPSAIHKFWIDPIEGLKNSQSANLSESLGISGHSQDSFIEMVRKLTELFVQRDCSMIEINPLVKTSDDIIVALDAKVSFDESASFRNPWLEELRDLNEESEIELRAQNHGLSYVDLDGNIGCLVNGAGLAMATMDAIKLYGGEPANFLDIGGGADANSITTALEIILEDSRLDGILVNIFGGIIRCDMVAKCILDVSKNLGINIPIVVRFSGTNHAEGKELLNNSDLGVITTDTLSEAGQAIVNVIGGN